MNSLTNALGSEESRTALEQHDQREADRINRNVLGYNPILIERVLHERFASKQVRGEWYQLDQGDLDLFNQICAVLGGVKSEDITPTLEDVEEAILDDHEGAYWIEEKHTGSGALYRYKRWRERVGDRVVKRSKYIGPVAR